MSEYISDDFLYKYIPKAEAADLQSLENSGDKTHVFSNRFLRKMRALIRQEQRSAFGRFAVKFGRAVAAVLILGILLNSVLIATVDAYREKLVQVIETVTEKFTSIVTDRRDDAPTTELIPVEPPYIPEGFTIAEEYCNANEYIVIYRNNEEEIYYEQTALVDGEIGYDTENAVITEQRIKDCTITIVEKEDTIQVFWVEETYRFWLISNTEKNSILDVAEKIIKR